MGRGKEGSPEGETGIAVPLRAALALQSPHVPTPGNRPRYKGQDSETATASVLHCRQKGKPNQVNGRQLLNP